MIQPDVARVLNFWFAPGREKQWFVKDASFDAAVRDQLGAAAALAAQSCGSRAWMETATGALALVLLLDQVPRNLNRGSAAAFATDVQARDVARAALYAGHDIRLIRVQRFFLYLPFEHSEDLLDQELSVALISALGEPELTRYARLHRDIVARFGRFPHRNATLGRITTAEEAAFLAMPNSSF